MTSKSTRRFADVNVGQALERQSVPVTVRLIVGGAIATRDYYPGHHDADAARELGSPHVFMNILTTSGLVQRYVEDWAGPGARFEALKLKLGAPNYPGDTMVMDGEVRAVDASRQTVELAVTGRNALGPHVTATVVVALS